MRPKIREGTINGVEKGKVAGNPILCFGPQARPMPRHHLEKFEQQFGIEREGVLEVDLPAQNFEMAQGEIGPPLTKTGEQRGVRRGDLFPSRNQQRVNDPGLAEVISHPFFRRPYGFSVSFRRFGGQFLLPFVGQSILVAADEIVKVSSNIEQELLCIQGFARSSCHQFRSRSQNPLILKMENLRHPACRLEIPKAAGRRLHVGFQMIDGVFIVPVPLGGKLGEIPQKLHALAADQSGESFGFQLSEKGPVAC